MVNSSTKKSKPYKVTRHDHLAYPHACEFAGCRKSFLKRQHLQVHLYSHDPKSKLNFKCKATGCSFTCSQSANLKAHEQSKHNPTKAYQCRYCDHDTSTTSAMWNHWNHRHSKHGHPWTGGELKVTPSSSSIVSGPETAFEPTDVDAEYSDDEEYLAGQLHPWTGSKPEATSSSMASGPGATFQPTDVDAEYSDDEKYLSGQPHPWTGSDLKATSSSMVSGSGTDFEPTDVDAEYSDDEEYLSGQPHPWTKSELKVTPSGPGTAFEPTDVDAEYSDDEEYLSSQLHTDEKHEEKPVNFSGFADPFTTQAATTMWSHS